MSTRKYLLFFPLIVFFCFFLEAKAFTGPGAGQTPGTGGGAVFASGTNIGIGTANPAWPLELSGNSINGTNLAVTNIDTGGGTWRLISTGSNNGGGAGNLRFYNGSVGPIFTATGYVGIATTSPAYALDVNGTIRASGSIIGSLSGGLSAANVSGPSAFGTNYGTYAYAFPGALAIGTSTTSGLQANSLFVNGNLGIGTAAPGTLLDVANQVQIAGSGATPPSGLTYGLFGYTGIGLGIYSGATSPTQGIGIWTNNGGTKAEVMRIQANGNVGIGTTGPVARFEVDGTSGSPNYYNVIFNPQGGTPVSNVPWQFITNGYGTSQPLFLINDQASHLTQKIFGIRTADAGDVMTILDSGYVGIGTTTPSYALDVEMNSSNIQLRLGRTGTGAGYADIGASNSGLHIYPAGYSSGEKISIDTSGDVGIATTTPAYPLTVNGVIYSSTGGFRFPDNSVQTTAYQGSTQAINAAYVTPGTFGSASTQGNYAFANGASTILQIDNTNLRVGIGIASPATTLNVYGTSKVTGSGGSGYIDSYIQTGASEGGEIHIVGNGGTGYYLEVFGGNLRGINSGRSAGIWTWDQSGNLTLGSNTYLSATGNSYFNAGSVGIGTTGPNAKLEVSGAGPGNPSTLKLTNTNGKTWQLGEVLANNNFEIYDTAVSSRFTIQGSTGNVGIGETNPGKKFVINNTAGAQSTILFEDGGTAKWELGKQSDNTFFLYDAPNARNAVSIAANGNIALAPTAGNVGIATTTPAYPLTVNGMIYSVTGGIRFPDQTVQTTAYGGGTQQINAAYVTPGTFGSASTQGNYAFANGASTILAIDNTNLRVGIGTATPADKLQVVGGYVSDITGRVARNLLDTNTWTVSNDSIGNWSATETTNGESQRIWGLDPFGRPALLWADVTDGNNDASGGWSYSNIPIDNNKAYRLTIWFKRLNASGGSLYLGCDPNNTSNLDGSANTNPYFLSFAASTLTVGRWYLFVGYIHAANDPSTTSYSAVYDGVTGQKVVSGGDFKNRSNSNYQVHRSFSYYNTTAGTTNYQWGPRFEVLDGSERSVEALLGIPQAATINSPSFFGGQLVMAATQQITWNSNSASNNINMQGGTITGVSKLTSTAIDPLYNIGGINYATYVPDTIGYQVEMFGKGQLADGKYVIDFKQAQKGSDAWLFWQTIHEGQDMKDVSVMLTPEGAEANLWYVLNPTVSQVIVYGDKDVTFSYHLVAPRYDTAKWTNISPSTEEGTVLPEK